MFKKIIIGIIVVIILLFVGCDYVLDKSLGVLSTDAEKKCNENDARACTELAIMYMSGFGKQEDLSQAEFFANKACNSNEAEACILLAMLQFLSETPEKAFQSLIRICYIPNTAEQNNDKKYLKLKNTICTPDMIQKLSGPDAKKFLSDEDFMNTLDM